MATRRVRVGQLYCYTPVMFDQLHAPMKARKGDIVRVINLHGCPPANTLGMCYVADLGGEFAGMVCTNSLHPVWRDRTGFFHLKEERPTAKN